ncbi:LOW QUALITY PROTEIN: zinc finger matrin-type protein 2-like [Uloborus diversus]|uniref:LOW QUALITY PROTEIN: zinc finger matrin-type protein 2-like n=1 Tax=Uloborus diversus TaxID=327109 RepID=UPI00240A605E|nr:LOW QUALITY PROTEIN: zinc finger matrin-type protein 2-like [Uloborus diversus]
MASTSRPDDYRRKWDRDEYEKLAREKLEDDDDLDWGKSFDKQPPVRREFLKPRDYRVDLESKLGKTTVITKTTPASQTGGYYCNVCDCVVKDSINFLDHINGKKHQRNLGMSMRIERSTLDQVKQRMEMNKRKREEKQKEYDFEQRLQELKDEEEKIKENKREKRKEKKRKAAESQDKDLDPDMAAIMGFSGFCSSKK